MLAKLGETFHFVIPVVRQLPCPLLSNDLELHQRSSLLCQLVESEAEEQFLEDALGLRLGLLCEHDGVGIGGPACKTRLELESQYLTLDEGDRFHLQCLKELNVGTQKDLLL